MPPAGEGSASTNPTSGLMAAALVFSAFWWWVRKFCLSCVSRQILNAGTAQGRRLPTPALRCAGVQDLGLQQGVQVGRLANEAESGGGGEGH